MPGSRRIAAPSLSPCCSSWALYWSPTARRASPDRKREGRPLKIFCPPRGTFAPITVSTLTKTVHDRTRARIARGSVEHDGAGVLDADSPGEDTAGWLRDAAVAVPVQPGRLPDGRPILIMGDVRGCAAFNHLQGDNPEHDRGDCGIVSCADVLNQFGMPLTETDAFLHAARRH